MRKLWPEARLPKEMRTRLIGTSFLGIVGAFAFAKGLDGSSGPLSAAGAFVMCGSFAVGAQPYLSPSDRWYTIVLETAWRILCGYLAYVLSSKVENAPLGGRLGPPVFVVWTLMQMYVVWFLWRTDDPQATGLSPDGRPS